LVQENAPQPPQMVLATNVQQGSMLCQTLAIQSKFSSSSVNKFHNPLKNIPYVELIEDLNYEKRRLAKEKHMKEMET
jgi:hypothetical protein